MNLDPLETTEDPAERGELVTEGVATPIKGDDEAEVSPRTQENMKFFSQNSASNQSKSTEDTAHEADKRKHFQKLGSAAFVGMDGLNSPVPGGGRGMGGRGGQPARRRTFHNTPVSSADDHDPHSSSAASLMNMPPPRTRQAETPVTPFVRASSQYSVRDDSLPATQTPPRPASMAVRRSVASSLFAGGDSGDVESEVSGGSSGVSGGGSKSTVSFADNDTTATTTTNATTLPTPPHTASTTHSSGIAATSTESTTDAAGILLQYSTSADNTLPTNTEVENVRCDESTSSTNSTYSTYSDIVRTVPSVDDGDGQQVNVVSVDVVGGEVNESEVCSGVNTNNNSSYDIPVHEFSVDDVCDDESTHHIHTGSSIATIDAENSDTVGIAEPTTTDTITDINTNTATTRTAHTTHTTHPDTHDHNTHDHNTHTTPKNSKAFVAPTYVQHPVSYLKVGKGTVGISTSVSASANHTSKSTSTNNNSGNNITNSSSAVKIATDISASTSASASGASTDGCTNAERAKAMVSVGSVKDRIKKFETLKTADPPAPPSVSSDAKKNSFRRSSLS